MVIPGEQLLSELLVGVIALPAGVALALLATSLLLPVVALRPLPEWIWRAVGLGTSLLVFGVILLAILPGFDPERLGLQIVATPIRSTVFSANLVFGVDGIGLFFLLSTAGLVTLVQLATAPAAGESVRAWVFFCLLLESTLLGALASANFLAFVFFWAGSIVPILIWLGRWGRRGRNRAASRIWTLEAIGLSALLFVAFVLHESSTLALGQSNLDLVTVGLEGGRNLLDVSIERDEQWVLFLALIVGLAMRLPLVPFHFWLPAAQAAAPTGLSVLLATGFVQTAAVGLLRFALPLFPDAARAAGPTLSALGIFALVYASLIALVQKELKRLVAYASVGSVGFAVFGIATLNVQGLTGAVVQLLTHGLAIAGLFILIGFLAVRRRTTQVAAFGGLAKPMPVCAFFFALMVLSLMGLPLLGGFVGDLFVLLGSLETRRELSAIALVAMVLAASYLLWVQRQLFLGPVDEPANRGLIDLDRVERGVLVALAIPIVMIGVYPNPVLRRVEPTVLEILYRMEQRSIPLPASEPASEPITETAEGDAS